MVLPPVDRGALERAANYYTGRVYPFLPEPVGRQGFRGARAGAASLALGGRSAMTRRWTPGEDTAVRLADALDYEHGGRRLVELAERLGRSEAAVRQRASRLRLRRLDEVPDRVAPA